MSGLMDDYSVQGNMLMNAYEELQKREPGHELLGYMEKDKQGYKFTEAFWRSFQVRGDLRNIHAWARYTFALGAACRGWNWRENLPKIARSG